MTTEKEKTCKCGGPIALVDSYGNSFTVRCKACAHCSLVVARSDAIQMIRLADFHLKRGDAPDQRPLDDLAMASRLVRCLVHDEWPTFATITDYGIESASHLGALQYAVRSGCSAYDLDRVTGDGPAITELVRAVPVQPYLGIEFQTPYDGMISLIANRD